MSQQRLERVVGVQTTTGAATAVLASYSVPDGTAVSAAGNVVGRETTTGAAVALRKSAVFKRVSGSLSVVGSVLDAVALISDAALALVTATIAVNGNALELRATGVAGQNVEWTGELVVWMG